MIQRVTKRRGNISWHEYTDDCKDHAGKAYPGATTLINKKANHFLNEWFKKEGARAVLQQAENLPSLMAGFTEDSLVKMFASSADKKRDDAGDRGTRIHAAIEHFLNKEKVADCAKTGRHVEQPCPPDIDDIKSALAGFWKWVQAAQPRIVATEFMVISHEERYAATGDLACWLGDDLWLIDAKTSKGVYETTALQLAAIRWAEHGDDGKPPPQATHFGVLHVRDDATELVPFDVTDAEFEAFLACRDLYEWDKQRSRKVKAA